MGSLEKGFDPCLFKGFHLYHTIKLYDDYSVFDAPKQNAWSLFEGVYNSVTLAWRLVRKERQKYAN